MRDKFSELIEKGIASFDYVPTQKSAPDQCPICRFYNNIFSIPSDTHMTEVGGKHIITGHIIADARPGNKWDSFINSPCWGAVDFKNSGYYCLGDFLYQNGLEGHRETLNGDVVFVLEPIKDLDKKNINVKESQQIDEAANRTYRVSFLGAKDEDNIPFTVTIIVDKENIRDFEDFLQDEQDNIFAHAEGGQVEY